MRWIVIVLVGIAALVAVVTIVGVLLPQSHVATRERSYPHSAEHVFGAISDVRAYPRWRPGVSEVTVLATEPVRWREVGSNGTVEFEVTASEPPLRQVVTIVSKDLPFGGRWDYVLAQEGSGTRLTISEHGEVYNPIFRFMARFIFGYAKTLEDYLAALAAYLAGPPAAA
ncbi:MAG: SRPBCC family protein [Gemmatimonadaceae bacterium]